MYVNALTAVHLARTHTRKCMPQCSAKLPTIEKNVFNPHLLFTSLEISKH